MNGIIIFLWILGLYIFYFLIKSAIDNSETAENIRIIKEILSKKYPIDDIDKEDPESKINEVISNGEVIGGHCPACNAEVPEDASECHSCGLSLK